MIGANTHAAFAAPQTPRSAIDWQVIYRPYPLKSAHISGHVLGAETPQKRDGETQTLVRLATLLAEAKHARNLRRGKEASICEAKLRDLRHAILREGMRK